MIAYYRFGPDSAEAAFRRVRELPDVTPDVRLAAIFALSNFALLRGRFDEGERLVKEGWAENVRRGESRSRLTEEAVLAFFDGWYRDEPEAAQRRLEAALRTFPVDAEPVLRRSYFTLAMTFAIAGRPDRARQVMAQYDAAVIDTSLRRAMDNIARRAWTEIALAERRPLDAIREIRATDFAGCRACADAELGRALDQAGLADSAIVAFERYLADRSLYRIGTDQQYLPGIYRRLGELYEARGDTARAHAMFRRFIELWSDGDPEARERVRAGTARLRAEGL